jgi:hypothetical protein|tara:strand:- start:757 stop:1383 length:627 start_codon:yes stop_codon:yes gene_type:complete
MSGMEPALLTLLGAGLSAGGGAASAMFGPNSSTGPFRSGIADKLLNQGVGAAEELGGIVTDRLAQDVKLPDAYVQAPQTFSGGGLPMPLGIFGQDPAIADPSMLSIAGLPNAVERLGGGEGAGIFGGSTDSGGGGGGPSEGWPTEPTPEDGLPFSDRTQSLTQGVRESLGGGGNMFGGGAGNIGNDDVDQAQGAVDLLSQSILQQKSR